MATIQTVNNGDSGLDARNKINQNDSNLNAEVSANTSKLATIETGATADQTDAEIETAYSNQVPQVSALEKTNRTELAVRRFSPKDIADMVDAITGLLSNLTTTDKTNLVAAINEVKASLSGLDYLTDEDIDTLAELNAILTDANFGALALLDTVGTSQIDNQAVTNTKLANMNAYTVKGRTSGNGAPQDLSQSDLQDGFDMMIRGDNGEMSGPFWTDGQSSYYLQDGLFRVIFSAFSSQIELNGGDFSFLSDEGTYRKKIVVDTTTQQIRLEIRVKGTDALVHSLILDSDGLRRGTAVSGIDDREVVDRAHVEGLIDWDAAETYTGSSGTETQNDATTDISGQTGTSVYNFLQFDATTSGRTSTGNKNFILLKQDTVEKFRVTTDGHVFLATGVQLFTDGTTPSGTNSAYDIVLSTNGKIGTTAFTTSFIQMGNSVVVEANSNITLTFRDNLLLNTTSDGSGDKVIAIGNANTAPSVNPIAGGIMWIDAGSGKYLGPNGNTITWAPTSPQTGYTTFTNLTTSRTCDADTVTTAELADIVGTLIEDIKTLGYIKA